MYTPFEIQHTREGMLELVSLLHSSGEEVRVVLESTGSYHCPVVAVLVENEIFVSIVNSLRMKRFCSQSIRKVKTDRIDAMQIALYGLTYWQELQPVRMSEDIYRELQLLARQYYQMTSILIKEKVDFSVICDQVLPGMLNENTIATHRVVGIVPDEDNPTVIRFRTKGDANDAEDGGLVHYKNVITGSDASCGHESLIHGVCRRSFYHL